MFYVNKIIGWVLSPLGMLFLGCLCGAMLRRCGGRIGKRGLHRLGTLLVSVSLGLFCFAFGISGHSIRFIQ